jgi:glucose-6-phosphate-specific signal transduction histidine kinase
MKSRATLSRIQEQQGKALLLFMVVVGYIVTFLVSSKGGDVFSFPRLVLGISYGVIYLVMGLFDEEILEHFRPATRNAIFFTVQLGLVFGIGWTLGPGGHWLIGLPLAGIAVNKLQPGNRWLVYLSLVAIVMLPIGLRYSTWETAFLNGFIISTAILFVAVFSQFRLNEQNAREQAEKLAKQLEMANHQLAEYSLQAEELAATKERNRLAREIHDNLGHYLTIINVQIEAARLTLDKDPARVSDVLIKAQELARKGLTSVRESVAALRVSPIEDRPLEHAISELVEEAQSSGISIHFTVIGERRCVESTSALAIYRAAQEALTNVRKHSGASRVDVCLDFSRLNQLRFLVRDNGVGARDTSGGFGLIGISERIQALGGEFNVETQPDQGFCIEVVLPIDGGRDEHSSPAG